MKKTIVLILVVALTALALCSCGAKDSVPREQIVGHYIHKYNDWEGFSIDLNADGTFSYYEAAFSSHIGMGNYTIDGDVITLTDELPGVSGTITRNYRFKYENDKLVFLAGQSGEFMYVDLPDGTVFERYELSDFTE